ncbi:MAG: helix-turn-helix domain-containing protein [Nanoarchaeota archaeon]|nr:helix-turn-helix domain-containing protein [Nanoarchaeota archaeon]
MSIYESEFFWNEHKDYYRRMGYNLLGILNDFKLEQKDLAEMLGVPVKKIDSYIHGEKEMPHDFIRRVAETLDINVRDLYVLRDDCHDGVKVMRREDSQKTSRVKKRAVQSYYEYRDTVVSTVAQFRPEWIKQLCIVDDNDPDNPVVQWNNGHFLHQFTYFVGSVNFYYKGENGNKEVAVMNTGDSMYITPFVPHTFATRKNEHGEHGLILALTYGNKLAGETQQELSALGPELAAHYALDFSSREKAIASLIRFHREAASLDYEELARRTKLPVSFFSQYENGEVMPLKSNLELIASALNIDVRELLPPDFLEQKVIVQKYGFSHEWKYPSENPSYKLVELAGTRHLPHSKSLEVNIINDNHETENLEFKVGLHQYGYNLGDEIVYLNWKANGSCHGTPIRKDDSFYIKPFVPHNFRGKDGKLLLLRIGGRIAGEPQRELSLIGKENVNRAIGELTPWFNKEGRNKI